MGNAVDEVAARPARFWDTVSDHVTATVDPILRTARPRRGSRDPVIAYLRDLEGVARRECESRDAIQVIASARRVLGDRAEVGPAEGPFSRS